MHPGLLQIPQVQIQNGTITRSFPSGSRPYPDLGME
jgi:hypothetical protein